MISAPNLPTNPRTGRHWLLRRLWNNDHHFDRDFDDNNVGDDDDDFGNVAMISVGLVIPGPTVWVTGHFSPDKTLPNSHTTVITLIIMMMMMMVMVVEVVTMVVTMIQLVLFSIVIIMNS